VGDEKRVMVRAMFDSIAPRYDLVNRLISCGLDKHWRNRTADALGLPPRSRVLDLACGTGDFCRLLAGRGMRVFGIDMSGGMLQSSSTDAPLVLGDALALPLCDGSVDGVVCGFALRNFVDIPPVVQELARVVRPGGRIAILEVSRPPGVMSRAGYRLWFEHAVPVIGSLVSDSAAYRYLPDSVAYLPSSERLRQILRSAGFAAVGRRTFTAGATQLFTATRSGMPTASGSEGPRT
jgi:demethylmenaquinone methyltransferase / 2-methoxy-6-polyprenyl-1,4-benzoquinol methylase